MKHTNAKESSASKVLTISPDFWGWSITLLLMMSIIRECGWPARGTSRPSPSGQTKRRRPGISIKLC